MNHKGSLNSIQVRQGISISVHRDTRRQTEKAGSSPSKGLAIINSTLTSGQWFRNTHGRVKKEVDIESTLASLQSYFLGVGKKHLIGHLAYRNT